MYFNINNLFGFIFLSLPISIFFKSQNIRSPSVLEINTCTLSLEADETILQLGDSIRISPSISCPTSEIMSFSWEPTIGLSLPDNLYPFVRPLQDQCYALTINWQDGCVSEEEICFSLKTCENDFSENSIASISPLQIETEATIELEIARRQFVHIVIEENDEVQFVIWEGWLNAGLRALALDFTNIPNGNHNLTVQLYPEDKSISIEKI